MSEQYNSENYKNNYLNDDTSQRFCNDSVSISNSINSKTKPFVSANQRLAGPPNPKTLKTPVIPPPVSDLSFWKLNNTITHSHINESRQFDTHNSGYNVSDKCGSGDIFFLGDVTPIGVMYDKTPLQYNLEHESPTYNTTQEKIQENFHIPDRALNFNDINTSCGYNIDNIQVGLPSNLATGNCQKSQEMSDYNTNLYTQTIQPGVYTTNQIIEPINSNLGISQTPQFQPVGCQSNPISGDVFYTEYDNNSVVHTPNVENKEVTEGINNSNIYDPRFNGYGTSYRGYTDDMLGQPKFYYDDVDSIRRPNYITRSNIDFERYADSYDTIQAGNEEGNRHTSNIRAMANSSFLKSTIGFRNDLTERMMRKNNSVNALKRQFPKQTQGVYMAGSMAGR
ncbi:MAG: hypothetical protein ACW98X_18525 [Promethearchaeota archaeon]